MYHTFVFLLFLALVPLNGFAFSESFKKGHRLYLGGEVYHMTRETETDTVQRGELHGVRGIYEKKTRCAPYVAFEGAFSKGDISGHTRSGAKITSDVSERELECRGGYCFEAKRGFCPSIVPFVGYGNYEIETNFIHPSPLPCKFKTEAHYFTLGFLAEIWFPWVGLGIKADGKYIFEGKNKITNDPFRDDIEQLIDCKWSFDLVLPIYIQLKECNKNLKLVLSPFWKRRHLGGRENNPSDFYDTKIDHYGGSIQLAFIF